MTTSIFQDQLQELFKEHWQSGHTLADLLREDLLAERVVIKLYGDFVAYFGMKDATTRRLFEDILAQEEEHADELADQLDTLDPETGKPVEQFTGDRVAPLNGERAKV
jgi:bacterioferritin